MSRARDFADLAGSADAGGITGKNLIINGAMQVAQRGTSFTNNTTSWAYSLDRWKFYSETGVSATVDKVTITKDSVSVDALHWQQPSTTGATYLGQVIEGTYLRGKTATVSFWVDTVTNVNVMVYDSVTGLSTPQAVTTGLNTYTATFANNFTADTATLYFQSPAGASELKVTDVQLEVGEQATPFEHRSFGDELARCQRYYEQFDFGNGTSFHGAAQSTNQLEVMAFFAKKRATPTIGFGTKTDFRINDWRGHDEQCNGTINVDVQDADRCRLQFQKATANLTTGYAGYINRQTGSPKMTVDAEL